MNDLAKDVYSENDVEDGCKSFNGDDHDDDVEEGDNDEDGDEGSRVDDDNPILSLLLLLLQR